MGRAVVITSAPVSPTSDLKRRMITYSAMMGARVALVFVALFTSGWWQIAAIVGAVILPNMAVQIANAARVRREAPEPPGQWEVPQAWVDEFGTRHGEDDSGESRS